MLNSKFVGSKCDPYSGPWTWCPAWRLLDSWSRWTPSQLFRLWTGRRRSSWWCSRPSWRRCWKKRQARVRKVFNLSKVELVEARLTEATIFNSNNFIKDIHHLIKVSLDLTPRILHTTCLSAHFDKLPQSQPNPCFRTYESESVTRSNFLLY